VIIEPFRFELAAADVDDLRDRLARTRWPEKETVDDWSQGLPLSYAEELTSYWRDGYDFDAFVERVNRFPQFRTEIDGLGPLLRALPLRRPRSSSPDGRLSGGFLKVMGPLTDPGQGGDAAGVHVVCRHCPATASATSRRSRGSSASPAAGPPHGPAGLRRLQGSGRRLGLSVTGIAQQAPGHVVGITEPADRGPRPDVRRPHRRRAGRPRRARARRGVGVEYGPAVDPPQTLGYALVDSPAASARGSSKFRLDRLRPSDALTATRCSTT
jgi:hypothetical protein